MPGTPSHHPTEAGAEPPPSSALPPPPPPTEPESTPSPFYAPGGLAAPVKVDSDEAMQGAKASVFKSPKPLGEGAHTQPYLGFAAEAGALPGPKPTSLEMDSSPSPGAGESEDMLVTIQLKAWANTLGLARALTQHLPRPEGAKEKDALAGLAKMTDAQVDAACAAACKDIATLVKEGIKVLAGKAAEQNITNDNEASGAGHSSKYDMWDEDWSKGAESAVQAQFGKLEHFYKGLDWHLGLPNPDVMRAMHDEHTKRQDSEVEFTTHNYGSTSTTPAQEWEFVCEPVSGKAYPGKVRQAEPLNKFLSHPMVKKANLSEAEVMGMRLYTGPMYLKYNASLRGFPSWEVEDLRGNRYVTTIHAIVSGVVKLSRVWRMPEMRKLYRGLRGCKLPDAFWMADDYGCRGGVEFGLLSTTARWGVAVTYSSHQGGALPTVFEIDVGQIDRGASLSWLSQYPKEEEILMPPLSNLEVVGSARMERTRMGKVMVIPMRVNVNIKSLLLDELLARRKMLHLSMVENLFAETRRDMMQIAEEDTEVNIPDEEAIVFEDMLLEFKDLMAETEGSDAALYNEDKFYHDAMSKALAVKKGTLCKFKEMREQWRNGAPFEVRQRVHAAKCIDFARPGFIYYIRSGTNQMPWDALAEGKLSDVEIPPTLSWQQTKISWECIRKLASGPAPLKSVSLRGQGQTTVKVDPQTALLGTEFSLGGQKLGPAGSLMLVLAFELNPSLTKLDLSGSRMTARVAEQIARVLAKAPSLATIKVRGAEIAVDTARHSPLLNLPCTRVGSEYLVEDSIVLAEFISQNKGLQTLNLEGHLIRAEGATALSRVLKNTTSLVHLNLRGNHIRTSGARALSEALQSSNCLKELVLLGNKLGIGGAKAFIAAIQAHPQLVSLNGIVHEENTTAWDLQDKIKEPLYEAVFVATRMRNNPHLTSLNLAGNSLGQQGANALRKALNEKNNLTSLNLKGNNLRADGIETIAEALRTMEMLKDLDLSQNQIGIQGTISLSKALVEHPHLRKLTYLGNIPGSQYHELDIFFLRYRHPYKDLYSVLPKRCQVIFFNKDEFYIRIVSCVIISVGSVCFLFGCSYAPMTFGSSLASYNTSIVFLASSFLGLFVWALKRHSVLRRFGVKDVNHTGFSLSKRRKLMIDLARISSLKPSESRSRGSGADRGHFRKDGSMVATDSMEQLDNSGLVNMGSGVSLMSVGSLSVGVMSPTRSVRSGSKPSFGGLRRNKTLGRSSSLKRSVEASRRAVNSEAAGSVHITPRQKNLSLPPLSPTVPRSKCDRSQESLENSEGGDEDVECVHTPKAMDSIGSYGSSLDIVVPHAMSSMLSDGSAAARESDPIETPPPRLRRTNPEPITSPSSWMKLRDRIGHKRAASDEEAVGVYESDVDDCADQDLQAVMKEQCKHSATHSGSYLSDLMKIMLTEMERSGRLSVLHSSSPISTALSQRWFQLVLIVVILYFLLHSMIAVIGLISRSETLYSFTFFRFTSLELRDGSFPHHPHVQEIGLYRYGCPVLPLNTTVEDSSITVAVEEGTAINGWYFVTSGVNDSSLDPVNFTLTGSNDGETWQEVSSSQLDCALSIWSGDWEIPDQRNSTIAIGLQPSWQCVNVGMHSPVLALGFIACLCLGLLGAPRLGKWALATSTSVISILFMSAWVGFYSNGYGKSGWWLASLAYVVLTLIVIVVERYLIIAMFVFGILFNVIFGMTFSSNTFWEYPFDVIPAFVLFVLVGIAVSVQHQRQRRAAELLLLDSLNYCNTTWKDILGNDQAYYALQELKEVVGKITPKVPDAGVHQMQVSSKTSAPAVQSHSTSISFYSTRELKDSGRITSLDQLYAQASALHPILRSKVQCWADISHGSFLANNRNREEESDDNMFIRWHQARGDTKLRDAIEWAQIKSPQRAIEKAFQTYCGDVSRLLDITRQTIYFQEIEHISTCLGSIWHDEEIMVERIKNRMDPEDSVTRMYGSYRDIMLNIRIVNDKTKDLKIDKHVCEVRLVLQCFAEVFIKENTTHAHYVALRNEMGHDG